MAKRSDVAFLLLVDLLFLVVAHGQGATIPAALGVAVASFCAGAILVVVLSQEDRND